MQSVPANMKILIISKLLPSTTGVSGAAIVYQLHPPHCFLGWEVDVLAFAPPDGSGQAEAARLHDLVRRSGIAAGACRRIAGLRPAELPSRALPLLHGQFAGDGAPDREMVRRERYHVVLAEFSEMGQYLFGNPHSAPCAESFRHECRTAAWARAMRLHLWRYDGVTKRLHFNRLRRYEFAMYRNMDHVLALTSRTPRAFEIRAQPAGSRRAAGNQSSAGAGPPAAVGRCLLFIGCYANEANRDAVRWFARAVWPLLKTRYPDLLFYVVGYAPPAISGIWAVGTPPSSSPAPWTTGNHTWLRRGYSSAHSAWARSTLKTWKLWRPACRWSAHPSARPASCPGTAKASCWPIPRANSPASACCWMIRAFAAPWRPTRGNWWAPVYRRQ